MRTSVLVSTLLVASTSINILGFAGTALAIEGSCLWPWFRLPARSECSVFDYLTFGILLCYLYANVDQFRTGWFLESVISAVLIVGTRKPFYKSIPGKYLLFTTIAIITFTFVISVSTMIRLLKLFSFHRFSFCLLVLLSLIYLVLRLQKNIL